MASIEQASYPTEAAISRLIADKEAERRDQAQKLGQQVWRNIDLAKLSPLIQYGSRGDAIAPQG